MLVSFKSILQNARDGRYAVGAFNCLISLDAINMIVFDGAPTLGEIETYLQN